jgi:probable phosphoglycerate mutase
MTDHLHLWLVRHGQTVWNARGLVSGWSDIELSELGQSQALDLQPFLSQHSFDGVWSSSLQRARNTARLAGFEAKPDARLRELGFGDLEGAVWETMDSQHKDGLLRFADFQAPNGEHVGELRARVLDFVEELEPGVHLIFCHAAVIRMMMREVGEDEYLPPTSIVGIDWLKQSELFVRRGPG